MAPAATYRSRNAPLDDDASLPVISLTSLLEPSPATSAAALSLLSAFKEQGFLYLTDFSHIIPTDTLEAVFASSALFFKRPLEDKKSLAWTTPRANRGYTSQGQEKTSRAKTKEEVAKIRKSGGDDLKESFEIGRENQEGCPNRWPDDELVDSMAFKTVMKDFFQRCRQILSVLMRGISIGMGLEESFFDSFLRTGDNTLRLLHYGPVAPGGFEGGRRVRAGAHTDYGTLTLLFQDLRGGLQVERPGGGWMNVTPMKGALVVNAGDLLARWSNDLIRSTVHRVVEAPSDQPDNGHPARYSIAYFGNPDFDRLIEALPGTWEGDKGGKKYEPVNSGDYLEQRLSATY